MIPEKVLMSVTGLNRQFGTGCPACEKKPDGSRSLRRNLCPRCGTVYALDGISLQVNSGEVLGIVGESGSGKSTLMKCLYFDQESTAGDFRLEAWDGGKTNALEASSQIKRHIRNTVLGMVYQNPLQGLRMEFSSVGNIAEKLIAAGNRQVGFMTERASSLLTHVGIPEWRVKEAPLNFSGGMQQRVQIAKALSNKPPILLLDEITTGLDVSVQAKVLDLIRMLRQELEIGILLVSHDLGVIRMLAERTIVMLDGRIVEEGLTDQILEDPQHPYTQELVHSLL